MTTNTQISSLFTKQLDIPQILKSVRSCQGYYANILTDDDIQKIALVYENCLKKGETGYVWRQTEGIARSLLITDNSCLILMTRCKTQKDIRLGKGYFKVVKLGVCLLTGNLYAIGIIKTAKSDPDRLFDSQIEDSHNEVLCAQKLKGSPYTVQYYGYHQTKIHKKWNKIFITMEYCNKDTLFDFHYNILIQYPLSEKLKLMKQFCIGLNLIHSLNMVYRDIKPENVLLHEVSQNKLQLKIVDFGLCSEIDPKNPTPAAHKGTFEFLSPEIAASWLYQKLLKANQSTPVPMDTSDSEHIFPMDTSELEFNSETILHENPARDIWAYGIVLFEFLNPKDLKAPFLLNFPNNVKLTVEVKLKAISSLTQEHINKKIVEAKIDSRLHPLLQNTLAVDPNLRWTIDQVKQELSKLETLIT
jgi:serine/threonine protein kinase